MRNRICIALSVFVIFFFAGVTAHAAATCPCTIWPASTVPTIADSGPDSPVELGVTFHADTSGFITGIRFYKSSGNTGTHVGNLWSSAGVLLATATFSGESASGWQQVNFSTPVAITANTNYVASYHTNLGHYSEDDNFFAASGVDNSPLHAIANGSAGMNGRYAYGSTSSFPNSTYLSANYWVEVVFSPATNTSVAPTITSQPASQTVTAGQPATFSVVASGTAPLSYQWRKNGSNVSGATSASYTTPATTATDGGSQFSVVVSNSTGSVTSANATLTVSSISSCPCKIWTSTTVPGTPDAGADSPVELGVTFRSDTNGYITGIRFYKSSANTGTHVGNLWSSSGTLLATAMFTGESTSGWQQVNFANAVAITANTNYVASYHANNGHYSGDNNYFASSGVDNSSLHAPANGSGVINGRYAYGSGSSFPNSTYLSSNYWVDVVFNTVVNAAPAPPVITSQPSGQTLVAGLTATFSVAASGTAPLSYQWRKNGINISSATSSTYTTPATATTDSGSAFSVVVSDSAGSVTSGNATLTVNAATRLLSANPASLGFGNVGVSSSSTLTTTFTNTGNSTVTIAGLSISGAGLSVSDISTGQMIGAGQSVTATVVFLPSITGSVTGSLTVSSNATNSPATVSLSGSGVQLVTHSTNLSWTASTSSVVGYNVYSGSVSGGPYSKLTSSPVAVLTYKDSTVQSGKTYYYVVTSVNSSGGESTYSNQATASIP
jgi:hypothetical protein